jgi:hypothetical protein
MNIKGIGKNKILKCDSFKGENDKYYFIYTTFFKNGTYYKGYHTTTKINDDYIGSSSTFNDNIKIDDIDRFEIIKFANNLNEIAELEKEHIGDEWKSNYPKCLNMSPGGFIGGWQVLPKEILDEQRRKNFIKFREEEPDRAHTAFKLGGINGAKSAHSEKNENGESLMTATANKNRVGKIKVRKAWNLITDEDFKIFPRLYKREENGYEFGSGMCFEELYNNELKLNGWYRPEWKTKGKKIHTEDSINRISNSCSNTLKGRKFTEQHKKNISISKMKKH